MTAGPSALPGDQTTSHTYVYDAWNRLVQVKDTTSGDPIVTYRYNGLHHRVRKLVGTNPSTPDVVYDYYYSPSWQLLQVDKTPNGESTFTYELYVWDIRYIDSPVCRFRDANSSTGDGTLEETVYYLNDANFNVVALADASGNVIERYAYSPYGEVAVLDEDYDLDDNQISDVENELLFQGVRRDPYTGIYDHRGRTRTPYLQWMQREPLGYVDGMSLYLYVRGNPNTYVDPSGDAAVRSNPNAVPAGAFGLSPSGDGGIRPNRNNNAAQPLLSLTLDVPATPTKCQLLYGAMPVLAMGSSIYHGDPTNMMLWQRWQSGSGSDVSLRWAQFDPANSIASQLIETREGDDIGRITPEVQHLGGG